MATRGPQASRWHLVGSTLVLLFVGCASEATPEPGPGSRSEAILFCEGPIIESWYGESPSFGTVGHPQGDVNVLGNVRGPRALASLQYGLNGGPLQATPFAPSSRRLQVAGDFNVELPIGELRDGDNELVLRAEDSTGASCTATLTVRYDTDPSWPLPYAVDFATIPSDERIGESVQVIDGRWAVEADGLRTAQRGYYRLLGVGERSWTAGYHARAVVTVHYLGDWAGIGFGTGWTSHEGSDDLSDWNLGALAWMLDKPTRPVIEVKTPDHGTPGSRPFELAIDTTYVIEMRTELTAPDRMAVDLRAYVDGTTPPPWLETHMDRRDGSLLLVAHEADVTWHELEVLPYGEGTVPTDGGGATSDAGAVADAGGGTTDAGVVGDGGGGSSGGGSSGGCSLTGTPDAGAGWVAGCVLLLLAVRRRRRRPRAPA